MRMGIGERFVELCGEVGNLAKEKTGISIVDAYFGPDELRPELQGIRPADELLTDLNQLTDIINDEITDDIRRDFLVGEIASLQTVVDWLTGGDTPYSELVSKLFHIDIQGFSERDIDKAQADLARLLPGDEEQQLKERVYLYEEKGKVSGDELKQLIEGELQEKAAEVGNLFKEKVFSVMEEDVTDNGVTYTPVKDKPWSGYNYYQGDFKSINAFNTDRSFNRHNLLGVVYHEYEHHVSALWREKTFRENGWTELSIVPLHTGRCVISEGTADTAREFLKVEESKTEELVRALYKLRRMTGINAAVMLNEKGIPKDEVIEYLVERGLRKPKSAKGSIQFIQPEKEGGTPNIWSPSSGEYGAAGLQRSTETRPTYPRRTPSSLRSWERTRLSNRNAISEQYTADTEGTDDYCASTGRIQVSGNGRTSMVSEVLQKPCSVC